VLLAVAVVRMACNCLPQYTGFFREISRLSIIMCPRPLSASSV
jgi:hypothetical protein